jgi:flagellar hook-associated protein 2
MATTSSVFTGSSNFSADFQQVVKRAVAIASLPITQSQNQVTALQSQSSALGTLSSTFSSLQSAVKNLESALGLGSFSSSLSTTGVATAALSGAPLPGSFSLSVVDIGAFSRSLSLDTGLPAVADPTASSISDATSYTLKVGAAEFTITPTSNSLTALADALNRNTDAHVQATVVNTGSSGAPNYQLSVQGTNLGDQTIQLTAIDGAAPGTDLLLEDTKGDTAKYRINGKPTVAIESNSRTIVAAPGVTLTLLAAGDTDVTVSRSTAAVSTALLGFVAAYNDAQRNIDTNRGSGTGALKGQSVLSTASDSLRRISGYSTGNTGASSLAALGLTFDSDGNLAFDTSTFASTTGNRIQQLQDFFGGSTTGGFLKAATDTLNTLTDSSTGVLTSQQLSLTNQITDENTSIAAQQARVDLLETNLNARMAAADAAVAVLEQQASYFTAMFASMRTASN